MPGIEEQLQFAGPGEGLGKTFNLQGDHLAKGAHSAFCIQVALDDRSIQQLIDCAWEARFVMKVSHSIRCEQLIPARQEYAPIGYNVISEGDINASFFYIIKPGSPGSELHTT